MPTDRQAADVPGSDATSGARPPAVGRRIGLLIAVVLAACLTGGPPVAAEEATVTLGVLPFSYLDTSFEPRDQSADHARRLAAMAAQVAAGLSGDGSVSIATVLPAPACAPGDSACILADARRAGASLVLTGAVQKVSTMATQMWVGVFDAETGERLFYRHLSFRGDTDEAWRRAAGFLVQELKADPPTRS